MPRKEVMDVYNKIAEDWDKKRKEPYFEIKKALLTNTFDSPCLDIGCGSGRYSALLPSSTISLDISIEMLKILKNKYPQAKVIQADACFLPFKNDVFGSVVSFATIHHLNREEQERALYEIRGILKEKGKSFISVWKKYQKKFFLEAILRLLNPNEDKDYFLIPWGSYKRPYYLFTKSRLKKITNIKGLKTEKLWQDSMNFFIISKKEEINL